MLSLVMKDVRTTRGSPRCARWWPGRFPCTWSGSVPPSFRELQRAREGLRADSGGANQHTHHHAGESVEECGERMDVLAAYRDEAQLEERSRFAA